MMKSQAPNRPVAAQVEGYNSRGAVSDQLEMLFTDIDTLDRAVTMLHEKILPVVNPGKNTPPPADPSPAKPEVQLAASIYEARLRVQSILEFTVRLSEAVSI